MFLKGATVPAISFRYGGKDISISDSYEDKATGLRVTVETKRFKDHPHAIDWVAYFENHGNADTPVIENILPLDLTAPMADKEKLTLHHAKGSSCHIDDFIPRATELGLNAWPRTNRITLAPLYGRSSNGTLPFMNLQRRRRDGNRHRLVGTMVGDVRAHSRGRACDGGHGADPPVAAARREDSHPANPAGPVGR